MRIHVALVFAPAQIQETMANYLCIGFVPGGTVSESTVSKTKLSEFFGPHRVLGREH